MGPDPSLEEDLTASSLDDLLERLRPVCEDREVWKREFGASERAWTLRVVALLRPGCRSLLDLADEVLPFLLDAISYEGESVREHWRRPGAPGRLRALHEAWAAVPAEGWTADRLGSVLREAAEKLGESESDLAAPARVAFIGKGSGPDPGEIAALLDRERTLHRLDAALRFLGHEPAPGFPLLRIR